MRARFFGQLLTLCMVLTLTACASIRPQLEQPNISLANVEIGEIGLLQQRYLLTLNVQNPNNFTIPVRGMSYVLQLAGSDFARGVSPKSFSVPAYGETQVQVEMTTNALSILHKLQGLLSGKTDAVSYQLSGKLDVGLAGIGTIPFRNAGEFKLSEWTGETNR